MAEFFALFFVFIVAAVGIACAINYFLDCGPWRALGFGFFGVSIFMIFAASGMWVSASRHDWGRLTPIFAFMLIGGWVFLKFGKKIWLWQEKRKKDRLQK